MWLGIARFWWIIWGLLLLFGFYRMLTKGKREDKEEQTTEEKEEQVEQILPKTSVHDKKNRGTVSKY
jgi:hypothetical protein